MNRHYIGLCHTYHDPALAIVGPTGEILFAEASERHLQNKRAMNCEPDHCYKIWDWVKTYCDTANVEFVIASNWLKKRPLYEKTASALGYLTAEGLLRPHLSISTASCLEDYKLYCMMALQKVSAMKSGVGFVRRIRETLPQAKVSWVDFNHHLTHAAVACYSSPFSKAACAIVDSFGELGSVAYYAYSEGKIRVVREIHGPASLGFFYMKLTELCGFDWLQGEEWKVMGLASYGTLDKDIYETFRSLLTLEGYVLQQPPLKKVRAALQKLQSLARRPGASPLEAANLAHTGQVFFTDIMAQMLDRFYQLNIAEDLVVSGGCALNSSFNGMVLEKTRFKRLHIPSAPADDGTAIGAALLAYYRDHPDQKPEPEVLSPYLGSTMSKTTVANFVKFSKQNIRHLPQGICEETAQLLAQGKLVGWVQGRAEFGPRALGNRSILADPRSPQMKDTINALVKFREEFRPFAPSILHEFGGEYFEHYQESPYMERTLRFKPEVIAKVPAVVHVDNTGRVHSVKKEWNEKYYHLLLAFHKLTGIPVLLNTSFNIMGKPIIHSVEDAVSVFFTTGLDALVIEDYLIQK